MSLRNSLAASMENIAERPTSWGCDGKKYHEPLLRSYAVLQMVRGCLERGDSAETILGLMHVCRGLPDVEPYEDEK